MNYHNITHNDMLNGPGLRVVLWVSGCDHYCDQCQNPVTWDPDDGLPFDQNAKEEIRRSLCSEYVAGLTLSGGDPLFVGNREEITRTAREVKTFFPEKTIWCYTGYSWEEVRHLPVMQYIDVLVDGEYKEELRDTGLHWVGSGNQRLIDVPKSLRSGQVITLTTEH